VFAWQRSRIVKVSGPTSAHLHSVGVSAPGPLSQVQCEEPYNVVDPDTDPTLPVVAYRMVRPWNQWLVGLVAPVTEPVDPTLEDFERRIRQTVGDDSLPLKILTASKWRVNDINAERYSSGRVFCMGDAVHRHPPANALGSNTCVQDAFNLAWKLSLVIRAQAHPRLPESFTVERQPVGAQIVARANKSFRSNAIMWDIFGGGVVRKKDAQERDAIFDTPEGRAELYKTLDAEMPVMWHAHGVEMTRTYDSDAIVSDHTPEPTQVRDAEVYYEPSARPGRVVPHAWLVRRDPSPCVSTLDLAGKGRFHLFTGHGGDGWRHAAADASARLGVEIGVTAIGPRLDYEDPYGTWRSISGTAEDGCVLVRPDLIVAWRSHSLVAEPTRALDKVMNRILGYEVADEVQPEHSPLSTDSKVSR
jgi:2,4-dichlorophenol 6-monooxygenase